MHTAAELVLPHAAQNETVIPFSREEVQAAELRGAVLAQHIQYFRDGLQTVTLIGGAPGMGKTTLAEQITAAMAPSSYPDHPVTLLDIDDPSLYLAYLSEFGIHSEEEMAQKFNADLIRKIHTDWRLAKWVKFKAAYDFCVSNNISVVAAATFPGIETRKFFEGSLETLSPAGAQFHGIWLHGDAARAIDQQQRRQTHLDDPFTIEERTNGWFRYWKDQIQPSQIPDTWSVVNTEDFYRLVYLDAAGLLK